MDAERLTRILGAIGTDTALDPATYPLRVCSAAVGLLGVTGAGFTVMSKGEAGAVWASDPLAQIIEDLQFSLGEGPVVDAYDTRSPALDPDLSSPDRRWPFFSPQACRLGVLAVFAFPLQLGVISLGAINLTRTEAGPLSGDQLADALMLADVATMHLIELQAEGSLLWPLTDRFSERARVHQATGMVAAQINSDLATALARLRGHAFANNVDVFEVAEQVVSRRLRLVGEPVS